MLPAVVAFFPQRVVHPSREGERIRPSAAAVSPRRSPGDVPQGRCGLAAETRGRVIARSGCGGSTAGAALLLCAAEETRRRTRRGTNREAGTNNDGRWTTSAPPAPGSRDLHNNYYRA